MGVNVRNNFGIGHELDLDSNTQMVIGHQSRC